MPADLISNVLWLRKHAQHFQVITPAAQRSVLNTSSASHQPSIPRTKRQVSIVLLDTNHYSLYFPCFYLFRLCNTSACNTSVCTSTMNCRHHCMSMTTTFSSIIGLNHVLVSPHPSSESFSPYTRPDTHQHHHPRPSAPIHIHPHTSAYIRIHLRTSTSIRVYPRPSTSTHIHPHPSTSIHNDDGHPEPTITTPRLQQVYFFLFLGISVMYHV